MSKRQKVEAAAAKVERHPVLAKLAGAGHVVNGIVHIIIGMIAIGVARGAGGVRRINPVRCAPSTPRRWVAWASGPQVLR